MELENVALCTGGQYVIITARPTLDINAHFAGLDRMIYQKFDEHDYQFRTFPKPDAYKWIPNRNINITLDGVRPSDKQRKYLAALLHTDIPVIQANSPFGVGKTLMIVMALIADRYRCTNAIHVATSTTNAATVAIAETFVRVADHYNLSALRVISTANHGVIDDKKITSIDFPIIWPRVFWKYAERADERMERSDEIDSLSTAVLDHLNNNEQLQGMEFRSNKILASGFQRRHSHSHKKRQAKLLLAPPIAYIIRTI